MRTFAGFLALMVLSLAAAADPPSARARAEIAKLAQLVGKWKGGSWIEAPGGRSSANSEETVEMRLDGRALLIEGYHTDTESRRVSHHALAILAWDDAREEYRFASALASGRTGTFPARLEGNRLVWTIIVPNGPVMRYTIELGDPGKWFEIGERSHDGGRTWTQFFEMKLDRVR